MSLDLDKLRETLRMCGSLSASSGLPEALIGECEANRTEISRLSRLLSASTALSLSLEKRVMELEAEVRALRESNAALMFLAGRDGLANPEDAGLATPASNRGSRPSLCVCVERKAKERIETGWRCLDCGRMIGARDAEQGTRTVEDVQREADDYEYLVERGWYRTRVGGPWVDPQQKEARYTLAEAVAVQRGRDGSNG